MSQPDSPPTPNSEQPLGNFHPLLPATPLGHGPLGQRMPQLQFMRPLGTKPLATLDPSVFWSEAQGSAAEIAEPFEGSPFFPEAERVHADVSASPSIDSPTATVQRSSLISQEPSAPGVDPNLSEHQLSDLAQHPVYEFDDWSTPESPIEHDSSITSAEVVQRSQPTNTNTPSNLNTISAAASSSPTIQAKSEADSDSSALTTVEWSGGRKNSVPPAVPTVNRQIKPEPSPNEPSHSIDEQGVAGWTYEEEPISPNRSGPALFQQDRAQQSQIQPEPGQPTSVPYEQSQQDQSLKKKGTSSSVESAAPSTVLQASSADNQSTTSEPPTPDHDVEEQPPDLQPLAVQRQVDETETISEPEQPAQQSVAPEGQRETRPETAGAELANQPSINSPEVQAKKKESTPVLSTTLSPESAPPLTSVIHDFELNPDITESESIEAVSTDLPDPSNLVQSEQESFSPLPLSNSSARSEVAIQRLSDPINSPDSAKGEASSSEADSSIDLTPSPLPTSESSSLVNEELTLDNPSTNRPHENLNSSVSLVSNQNVQPTISPSGSSESVVSISKSIPESTPDLSIKQPPLARDVEEQSADPQPLEVVQRQANETEVLSESEQPAEQSITPEMPRESGARTPLAEPVNKSSTSSLDIQAKQEENALSLNVELLPELSPPAIQEIHNAELNSADVSDSDSTHAFSTESLIATNLLQPKLKSSAESSEGLDEGGAEAVMQRAQEAVEPELDRSVDIPHSDIPLSTTLSPEPSSVSEPQSSEMLQRQVDETQTLPKYENIPERSLSTESTGELERQRSELPSSEFASNPSLHPSNLQAKREEDTLPLSAELSSGSSSSPLSAQATHNSEAVIQRSLNTLDEAVDSSSDISSSSLSVPESKPLLNDEGFDSDTSLVIKQNLEPDLSASASKTTSDSAVGQPTLNRSTEEQPAEEQSTVTPNLQIQDIVQRQVDDTQVLSQPEPIVEQSSNAEVLREPGGKGSKAIPSNAEQPEFEPLAVPASPDTPGSVEDIVQRSRDSTTEAKGDGAIDLSPTTSSGVEASSSAEALPSTLPAQIDQGAAVIQQKSEPSLSVSETAESVADDPALSSIDGITQQTVQNELAETSEVVNSGIESDVQQSSLSEDAIRRSPEQEGSDTNSMAETPTQWSSIADLLAQSTERDSTSSDSASLSQRSPAEPPPPAYPDLHPYEPPAPIQASPAPVPNSPFPPVIQRDVAPISESTTALAEAEQPPAEAESSEGAETADESALEDLAQTIYQMMQQRLMIERERLGRYYSGGFR